MDSKQLDNWWSSLSQKQKCHIASKVYHDTIENGREATRIWMLLDDERKASIHEHCTDAHGMIREEWTEGSTLSY